MRKRQFCTTPQLRQQPGPRAFAIADIALWLQGRQNLDGSWGGSGMLDRVVATNHATMALMAAGFPEQHPTIQAARRWMTSSTVQRHNNSYWVLGALAAFEVKPNAENQTQITALENILKSGAKPHPNQLVEAFYLRVLSAAQLAGDAQTKTSALEFIKRNYTSGSGWFSRADSTSDGYAALYEFDQAESARIRSEILEFLTRSAHQGAGASTWGAPISTAYTVMNIVSTDLIDDPRMSPLVEAAVNGIAASQKQWKDATKPFGGDGDISSPEYPTAVMCRAMIAALSVVDPDYLGALREAYFQRRIGRYMMFAQAAGIGAAIALFTNLEDRVGVLLLSMTNNEFLTENSGTIGFWLAITSIVIGVLVSTYPEQTRWLLRVCFGWIGQAVRRASVAVHP